jgi:protein-L-isoaspartate(D-aspartate) O-methyltransferase
MSKVPRHLFVPEEYRSKAYDDGPLPIGDDQTISQPYIVALMTELLELDGDEKVLEIGTGSGYQAAVLAEIIKEVYSIEIKPALHKKAGETLRDLGYDHVFLKLGNGYVGWEEHAPFDAILVTAAPTPIPQPLITQLSDGGIIVIPVETSESFQTLQKVKKIGNELDIDSITPVRFVPFILE